MSSGDYFERDQKRFIIKYLAFDLQYVQSFRNLMKGNKAIN